MRRIGICFTLVLGLFLQGCVSGTQTNKVTPDGNLNLGNNMEFKVLDEETLSTVNEALKSNFDSLKPKEVYEVSLYSVVEHPDYQLYISSLGTQSFQKLKARPLPSNSRMMQKTNVGNSFEYRLYQSKQDSSYVAELLYRLPIVSENPQEQKSYLVIGQTHSKVEGVRQMSRESMVSRFRRTKS